MILAVFLSVCVGFFLGVIFRNSATDEMAHVLLDMKADLQTVHTILSNATDKSEVEVKVAAQKARSILKTWL